MGLLKEPIDVDFVVESSPLTEKEKEEINEYIRRYKARNSKKHSDTKRLRTLIK
jgi:hypothetical protein